MGRRKFGRDFIDPPFCLLYSSITCFQGIQHGWVRVSCRGHTQMCLKPCFLTQLSAEKQVWSQHQAFPAPNFRWEYDQTPPPDGSPEPKAQPSGPMIQRGMKKQGKQCLSLASNLFFLQTDVFQSCTYHRRLHPRPLPLLFLFTFHSLPTP